jgi:hypothetical protein
MSELLRRAMTPFLPVEARYRLRQQRIDVEAARVALRVLETDGISANVLGTAFLERPATRRPTATSSVSRQQPGWFDHGRLQWDGTSIFVMGEYVAGSRWRPQRGGLRPGFGADEVSEARRRPVGSGECPEKVAAIAVVALQGHALRRVYLLDEESHSLAATPMQGLSGQDLVALADSAGVAFHAYSLATGNPLVPLGSVPPDVLCDALFPRSARRLKVANRFEEANDWWRGAYRELDLD